MFCRFLHSTLVVFPLGFICCTMLHCLGVSPYSLYHVQYLSVATLVFHRVGDLLPQHFRRLGIPLFWCFAVHLWYSKDCPPLASSLTSVSFCFMTQWSYVKIAAHDSLLYCRMSKVKWLECTAPGCHARIPFDGHSHCYVIPHAPRSFSHTTL